MTCFESVGDDDYHIRIVDIECVTVNIHSTLQRLLQCALKLFGGHAHFSKISLIDQAP